jgi:DNA polymerase I
MIVIVDGNNLAYKAKYSTGYLSYEDQATGVIFTFLHEVMKLALIFNTTRFVFAWDSKKSFRRMVYPSYKLKRIQARESKTDEEKEIDNIAFKQFSLLRKYVLPEMGFTNNFLQTGYEADDIIASVVYKSIIEEDIGIFSTDRDLYQLLGDRVFLISTKVKAKEKKGKTVYEGIYTQDDFISEWGLDKPLDWSLVLAVAGCGTDNVEGIRGVGKITAIKFVKEFKTTYINTGNKSKAFSNIYDKLSFWEKNIPLVLLPYPGTKEFEVNVNIRYKAKRFEAIFKEFGFKSFLNNLWPKWAKAFNL